MAWWHWLAGGLVLVGLELVIPSFTIVWFGLAAVLVGVIALIFPATPFWGQLLAWMIFSLTCVSVWFRCFNKNTPASTLGSASDGVIGVEGVVTSVTAAIATVSFDPPLLGAREWPCHSETLLSAGDRVAITAIVGHTLKVVKRG